MWLRRKAEALRQILRFSNRWQLVLARTVFTGTNLSVYRMGRTECIADHAGGDVNSLRYCLTSGPYRAMVTSLRLGPAARVVDLGANCGGFPILLHSLGIAFDALVCVELNPRTFTRLQFNVRHNIPGESVLLNAAVCGTRRTLHLAPSDGGTSESIYRNTGAAEGSHAIEGLLLDDVFSRASNDPEAPIDLCKIDVEGAEYEVFREPGHDALRRCRWLIIEIHVPPSQEARAALLGELARLGFDEVREQRQDDVYLFTNTALAPRGE